MYRRMPFKCAFSRTARRARGWEREANARYFPSTQVNSTNLVSLSNLASRLAERAPHGARNPSQALLVGVGKPASRPSVVLLGKGSHEGHIGLFRGAIRHRAEQLDCQRHLFHREIFFPKHGRRVQSARHHKLGHGNRYREHVAVVQLHELRDHGIGNVHAAGQRVAGLLASASQHEVFLVHRAQQRAGRLHARTGVHHRHGARGDGLQVFRRHHGDNRGEVFLLVGAAAVQRAERRRGGQQHGEQQGAVHGRQSRGARGGGGTN
mmetsp:Transcript_39534/g.117405  ORF Transcript_39534/g.117405 Transcript_39534/m.117405 type:complete len:265 (+) Transcript_39534:45-839(+)